MQTWYRIRMVVNILNLSTPLGLLIALVGGTRVTRGHDGLLLCDRYRLPIPAAPAFTVGNAVIFRDLGVLGERPQLLGHEARHATQYAWCVGLVMLPLYLICAGVSLVLSSDPASFNPFERLAGLTDGGYVMHPLRWAGTPAPAAAPPPEGDRPG